MEKIFYDQRIDADIKQYEDVRKLTTGQGDNCSTGCLLYRLIAVDLCRQR